MKKYILLLMVVTLAISACGPTQPPEPKVDRVAILENKVATIMADLDNLKRAIEQNSDAMDSVRDEIVQQLRDIAANSAKVSVKFDNFNTQLDAIRERLDDSEYRIADVRKEISTLRVNRVGTEYTRPTGTPERTFDLNDPDSYQSGVDPNANTQVATNETDAYEIPYNDFLRGDYVMAANGFRDYLNTYQEGAKREDARFNLAESLFNQGAFEGALEEYDTFILEYPNSTKAIQARYKKALSFLESNQTPSGVILLRQIINQYPESNEARLASEKLRSLGLNP